MTKVDIISGFLGAGKTTLIKKMLKEAFQDEKIVLIENEFGEIGIDGGFLQDAGIQVTEMNSGCICCSLVGDFSEALKKVQEQFNPDRIIIEPSGVGKLSEIKEAVANLNDEHLELNCSTTVVDGTKYKMYMKNFAEFFADQIAHAQTIVVSRTDKMDEAKLEEVLNMIREHNEKATIITTPFDQMNSKELLQVMEADHNVMQNMMEELSHEMHHHHHEHEECSCGHEHQEHHHEHEECSCGHDHHEHHHEHEECSCGHEHHEHHHEHEECSCGHDHHEHHHEHGEECCCGHEHHEHHHADEVFTSWGKETVHSYTKERIECILNELNNSEKYGVVLRAKGIVASVDNEWIYFDFVPEEIDIRFGQPSVIGRLCVIGSKINEEAIAELFGV